MNDLEKLFLSELKDMYDGEKKLVKALPEMAENAVAGELKDAFNEHLEQTKNHVNRLEQVFRALGQEPKGKSCKGLEGIIDEGEMIAKEFEGNSALDAALISAGQKAEHYEITSYGGLCTWAKELGRDQIVPLLKQNLSEEKEADAKLTKLAKESLNIEASHHDTEKHSEGAAAFKKAVSSGP
ncbi:MAG TPA: ferritin-like domain-containing protein [Verrucomicrobiae bacterium]|nr:ferritin-like domain-containing protein [Verrucomicrobiae bacterium]